MSNIKFEAEALPLKDLLVLKHLDSTIQLGERSRNQVKLSFSVLQAVIQSNKVVYGINTGFGKLANQIINTEQLGLLQRNLILSHATGTGSYINATTTRLIFAMKILSLSKGYSGVSEALIDYMIMMFNKGVLPLIPEKGSVGASGDLVPLAHFAMAIIGEGNVVYNKNIMPAVEGLAQAGLRPYVLAPKEGLALINGMQVSNALVLESALKCENLFKHAVIIGALTVDGACGSDTPFNYTIHAVRGHREQIQCARWYLDYLEGSEIRASHLDCEKVQDPYSLRCQPQVMGACLDQIKHVFKNVIIEANGVSDNPIVIPETLEIVSGGNFHGEIVAMAADNLALAIAEIGALSERRIALLIDSTISGLPPFLVKESGINSGFMIAHVTAAACASDNKALAHPHCVDSIPTSANQEDHVSMAANGARRLAQMIDNTLTILAIELLAACQALEFRKPLQTSPKLQKIYHAVREKVAPFDVDRYFSPDIALMKQLILSQDLVRDFGEILV